MATTVNGIDYEELAGSPEMDFGEQGISAIRRFRIAWADARAFVSELAGQFTTVGNQTVFTGYVPFLASFPTMVCVGAKVKPFATKPTAPTSPRIRTAPTRTPMARWLRLVIGR